MLHDYIPVKINDLASPIKNEFDNIEAAGWLDPADPSLTAAAQRSPYNRFHSYTTIRKYEVLAKKL